MLYVFIAIGVVALAIGIIKQIRYDWDAEVWLWSGGIILLLISVFLLVFWFSYTNDIIAFKTDKATIEVLRQTASTEYERAILTKEIIKWNNWLAKAQYWNKKPIGIAIPDEIEELTPIE